MACINFFAEGTDFKIPRPRKTASWIEETIKKEKKKVKALNYIFCTDEYLRFINIEYLNHKTYTDIITFNNSDSELLEGDIFISLERVKENAIKFRTDFIDELHRVVIHGALHLIGYSDKTQTAKIVMRNKEDAYLSLRS